MTIPKETLEVIVHQINQFFGGPEWEDAMKRLRNTEFNAWEEQRVAQIITEGIAHL